MFLKLIFFSLCFTLMASCKVIKEVEYIKEYVVEQKLPDYMQGGGSSGMCSYGSNSYLTVYDLKSFQEGSRVGFLQSYKDSLIVNPIKITEWSEWGGPSSDLESICKLSGRNNEFLIAESGNWQGKGGRIFHIEVDTLKLEALIKGVINIPMFKENNFGLTGDQYEGMICLQESEQNYILLLAERGGSPVFPNGIIRWASLNLLDYRLSFSTQGFIGKQLEAPGNWEGNLNKRDITDLYLDENNVIWSVGTEDMSDAGPFYSVIYQLGRVVDDSEKPFIFLEDLIIWKEIYGFKVEALARPSSEIPGNVISFGTEDEIYGGVWRVLK